MKSPAMTGQGESDVGRTITRLGRYLVIAELGRGGMAEVYLAVARGPSGFSKLVVLKLLRAQFAEEEQFLEMFLAEARLAARLNHPNVIQTYEVSVEGGRQCIVMEYLEGRTLSEAWHGPVAMPLPLAVRVLCDALSGLHHAHELTDIDGNPCGLVHRDISPQNIIVTYDGQVKVLDFGIAKANDSAGMTRTGTFKGKVRYAATERISGASEIDRRSDIFSMGVLLWEAAARQRLWSGMGDLAVMHRLASGEAFPPPSSVDPTIPEAIDVICARALSPRPEGRYANAVEMQDALEDYLASSSSVAITARAVAKFMTDTFATSRERFQRLVDEQLRAVAQSPADELPTSMSRIRSGEPRVTIESSSVSWVPAGALSVGFPPSSPAPASYPNSMLTYEDPNPRRRRLVGAARSPGQ
jgi:serine/threonine protein kinase